MKHCFPWSTKYLYIKVEQINSLLIQVLSSQFFPMKDELLSGKIAQNNFGNTKI